MRKRWTICLLVGAALVLGLVGERGAAATSATVKWKPCYTDIGPFECGTVTVPLDYDAPGETIRIALARLPASDPSQRIGSVFLNPGGPGGSGIEFLVGAGPFLYSDEVRAKFDLVGFDPRGILQSNPLRCFKSPDQWEPYFTPFTFPMTPEEEAGWITADRYLTSACKARAGLIAEHMSTANVARDLEVMRVAVGDEKLTYAGYSYGSFLGATYANMFPDKVRALVVDGVLDPIAWTTGAPGQSDLPFSTRLRSDAGAMATLNEFFRLCDAGDCPFGDGDAAVAYADLVAAVKADPSVINYSNLIAFTLGAMYDSFGWEQFAADLAALEDAVASDSPLRVSGERFRPLYGVKRGRVPYPNYVEGFPGVACTDSDNPDSYSAWSTAGARADAKYGYFGRIWTWTSSICAEWPFADADRYTGPFTKQTAKPVLVVGTRYDPATRYEGARKVHDLLPNSRLVTVEGWGHTSLFLSSCSDAIVSTYLLTSTAPKRSTCTQDFTPFN